jgi:hypothetical protein
LLANNGHSLPPSHCGVRQLSAGGCPYILPKIRKVNIHAQGFKTSSPARSASFVGAESRNTPRQGP